MPIQALIFDLDGVIADTAKFHYHSWKRLADEEGIPFSRADNDQLRGIDRRESLNRLLNGRTLDAATKEAWLSRKNDYYLAKLGELTPQPGVAQLLEESQMAGLKIGLASASSNARTVLEKLDLLARFDIIGDGTSVPNNKPAPDLFLWVAGGLQVSPARTIVFEDSSDALDAALASGFWTVGVGRAGVDHAHLLAPDGLAGLQLQTVLEVFAAAG